MVIPIHVKYDRIASDFSSGVGNHLDVNRFNLWIRSSNVG